MNFNEWYKSWRGEDYNNGQPKSGQLQIGWDACKKEVLKEINSCPVFWGGAHDCYTIRKASLIDKIEKL